MCGIAGIVDLVDGFSTEELKRMSSILAHRGPDDEGFLLFENDLIGQYAGDHSAPKIAEELDYLPSKIVKGLGFMHRRLSIQDLSVAGHQPMIHEDSGTVLNFNGEIYNFFELSAAMNAKGTFQSETDTEVVLRSYLAQGLDNVNSFRGMWAYALLDSKKKRLILSRDRFGIKPLYYHFDGKRLVFASEIKAILAVTGVKSQAKRQDVVQYISYGCLKNPHDVLFHGIKSVTPGEQMIIDLSQDNIPASRYTYYEVEPKLRATVADYHQEFQESINLHMRADVEVGSCLSGGLDSSAIVHAASRKTTSSFHTFTASYLNSEVDESDYARSVADYCDNLEQHFSYPSAEGLMAEWDKMIYHQDVPVGSSSIFAQWEVMKQASQQQMKVLLDGQGSDEVLGGYYNFAGLMVLEKLKNMQFAGSRKAYVDLKENFTPAMSDALKRASYPMLPASIQKAVRKNSRLGPNLLSDEMLGFIKMTEVPQRNGKSIRDHAKKSMSYGMYELLRYEDRNSMAFSIESRVPFLDHKLVEIGLGLKSDDLMKNGWTKWPIRSMLDGKLDESLVWRKDKKGFLTPQQSWKDQLLPFMLKAIDESRQDVFDKELLESWVKKKELSNSQLSELWRVFSVIRWLDIFKVELI